MTVSVPVSPRVNDRSVALPPVDDVTIAELLARRAETDPGHVLCTFEGRAWTFLQVNDAANRIANGLLASGLKPGDRVALMLPGHPDHIVSLFALAKAGLVRVPVNTSLIGPALAYPFDAFSVDALIADAAYAAPLAEVLPGRAPRGVYWRGEAQAEGHGYDALKGFANPANPPFPAADDIIAITPSSGTTGAPKGVLKSDRVLRAGPVTLLHLTEAKPGETFLFWEAMHHGAGVAVLIAAVMQKLTLGMVDRFSASRLWRQAKEMGANRVHYLGSVLGMLLRQPEQPEDRTHGVSIAWGGGCPAELWEAVEQRFAVHIREGYGLSEMTTFCTLNMEGRGGSVGLPVSWYEAAVMDAEGKPCAAGKTGELCFRFADPRVGFLGYFNNPAADAASWRDGWFRTGDLARQDEDGYLFFAGRAMDTIRRRGINISAWEVERVVIDHPAIMEVAMIGVPSELGEDEIKLFIRPTEGAVLPPAELLAWCGTRMPKFQLPRYIAFVEDFPRTPTQRIRKQELSRDVTDCWDSQLSAAE
jgi:crotonobetaine/carnitine-CoA ligase